MSRHRTRPWPKQFLDARAALNREISAYFEGRRGGEGAPLREVGERLGVTRERARQIESQSLAWIVWSLRQSVPGAPLDDIFASVAVAYISEPETIAQAA